jgi:hypothetical protein
LVEDLEFDLWQRWEFETKDNSVNLSDVLVYLDQEIHKGKLEFRDIFYGSTPIFLASLALI